VHGFSGHDSLGSEADPPLGGATLTTCTYEDTYEDSIFADVNRWLHEFMRNICLVTDGADGRTADMAMGNSIHRLHFPFSPGVLVLT